MAEEAPTEKNDKPEKPETPKDNLVTSQHSIVINGETINYTVTTGTIVLKEESPRDTESEGEKPKAEVFFIAYTKDDVPDSATRPVTFSFNGGPGSSSVWLHLGVLGPRRVWMDDDGNLPQPPFKLVDNEFSLLDETDLVFIDPVSTGYSRPVKGEKARQFHGFKKDIETVGEFIRLYCTRYLRWTSPKFLIGESYGTTRAAGLSGHLQQRYGLYLNGVMLISSILNFQTARFATGNDLPYILFLPTYAATAWYHNQLDETLQADLDATLREVEAFAQGQYATALMKGATLTADERAEIVGKLARYTGLSAEFIERVDLRIEIMRFAKELLRPQGLTVGRLDTRYTGRDRDSAGERFEFDPAMATIMGPYTATFYDYVRRELKFESDLPYEIINMGVWPWSYAEFENQYVDVAETLRAAIHQNPYLKVHVASGYYDLATPYFATEYTLSHMALAADLRDNIEVRYYRAGHMMYVHAPSLAQQKADLAAFVQAAKGG